MSRARPTFATAIALMLLALSPPGAARAGSYEVYSCHPDGIAHGWVPSHTAGATAYIECGSSATAAGLRARNVINGLMAPVFTNGQVAITSPPGTYFDWMRFDADLRAQIGWRAGIHDLVRRTWIWCGTSACTSSFGWRSIETPVAATRSLAVMTICSKLQCGPNTEPWGFLGIRNVRLRVQDPVKPSLRLTGGSLLSGGWLRKSASIQARADDNSGIREITIAIGNGLRLRHEPSCDFHRTAPCPASQSVANVFSLVTDADGSHRLRVRAVDAAGNATETTRTVRIDNTPPDRVTELGAQPASWSSSSRFDVSWTNPSSGAGSPVAAARYELCSDVCSAVRTVGGIGLERTQVSVPRPGKWRLRLWLVDSAGNEDRSAAQEIELLHDPTPPTLKFAPSELDNPGSLRIDVRDELSGVATTELELQREGDDIWLALPLTPTATGVVSFVDDEALPAGKYIVRARATDRAGNEDTVQGSSLELPFRLATKLTVGQQRRVRAQNLGPHRHRRVIVKNPRAAFGRKVRLTGRLTSPGRNPLASRDIDISELRADSAGVWRPIATMRTDARGRFVFKAPPGPSRVLRFRYPGSATVRGQTTTVALRVRAASTLRVSRSNAINGEAVTFRGVVQGEVPASGKLLQLQVYSRGAWLTFATPRADQRGRWSYPYRFTATRGVTRYRFRVRLPRETGFPYVPGSSRTVRVKVRGL